MVYISKKNKIMVKSFLKNPEASHSNLGELSVINRGNIRRILEAGEEIGIIYSQLFSSSHAQSEE